MLILGFITQIRESHPSDQANRDTDDLDLVFAHHFSKTDLLHHDIYLFDFVSWRNPGVRFTSSLPP